MKINPLSGTFLLPALLLLSTSCKKEVRSETAEENLLSTRLNTSVTNAETPTASGSAVVNMTEAELLKSVRNATSRFHSTTQAIAAGHEPTDHCVSVPGLGGMGYHWANPSLVDPVFDALKPEALLYATGPGGNLRLVAVEYIVVNVGQPRPMFGDQPFDIGGSPLPIPHWTLHVWLYENNPSGMFVPFNPNISCP
ncbi:MAG TPA: hypothetical protein VJ765_04870 [Chitinophagaceae bacterium]|nr:hypothetical protein [Chitinophagaceae bacterium]